jgi:hypothetical protein
MIMGYTEKLNDIGMRAKVLMDLHLENPKEFNAERILDEIMNLYENLGLDQE